MIRDILRTNVSSKTDLDILKRSTYKRLYGNIKDHGEFDNKMLSISFRSEIHVIYDNLLDELLNGFVLNNVGKHLNITFLDYISLPIEEMNHILNSAIRTNKLLLKIKEGIDDEIEDIL